MLFITIYNNFSSGKLSTKQIVSKDGNLSQDNKTLTMLSQHYKFRQRLISKAEEYQANVIEVNEYLTTKTCGGWNDPEKSKQYNCNSCNFTWGRDFNAARNIMIKSNYGNATFP